MLEGNQAEIFEILKGVLKARGKTYSDLARDLHVSEPTIKRLFSEKDCKFSRLLSICRVLDISVTEVLETAARSIDPLEPLSQAAESYFALNSSLFYFFVLLKDNVSSTEIQKMYDLSDDDIFLYGQELESLDLATVATNGDVRLNSTVAFRTRRDGPLRDLFREINASYVRRCYDMQHNQLVSIKSISRKMRTETVQMLQAEIDIFYDRITKLARQDRLLESPDALDTFKWLMTSGPADFQDRIAVTPHKNAKR